METTIDDKKCSKNSLIAKSGIKAEELFRTNTMIKSSIEEYFKLKIVDRKKVLRQKYDTVIVFDDHTKISVQNKKIENLSSRGSSFDRRHIKNTFDNQFIRKYLTHLTLFRKNKTETSMTEDKKQDFIKLCNNNLTDIKQYLKKKH